MRLFLIAFLTISLSISLGAKNEKVLKYADSKYVKSPSLIEKPSLIQKDLPSLESAPPQLNSILIDSGRNGYGFASSSPKTADIAVDASNNIWFGTAYRQFLPTDPNTGIIAVAELDVSAGFSPANVSIFTNINNLSPFGIGGRYPSFQATPITPVPIWNQYMGGTPPNDQSWAYLATDFFGWGPFGGGFTFPISWTQNTTNPDIEGLWLGSTDIYKDATDIYHVGGVWELHLNSGDYTFIHGFSPDLFTWEFENASLDWPATLLTMNPPRFAWGSNGFGAWVSTGAFVGGPDQDFKLLLCTTNDYGETWSPVQRFEFEQLGIPDSIFASDSIYIPDPNNPGQFILYTGPAEVGITYDFDLIVTPANELHVGCTVLWGPPVPNQPGSYYPHGLWMGLYDIHSSDMGATWTASRIWWNAGLLVGDSLGNFVTTNEIDLGLDDQGNLYAAWVDRDRQSTAISPYPRVDDRFGGEPVTDIFASLSTDGGNTWSFPPIQVTQDTTNSAYGLRLAHRNVWFPADDGKTYIMYQVADLSRSFVAPPQTILADFVQWYYIAEAKNFPTVVPFVQNVRAGWNLLGLPYDVDNAHYLSLYPGAVPGTLFGFDGSYFSADTMELGQGYWLRFTTADAYTIIGNPVNSLVLNLRNGWNLISGPSCDVPLTSIDDPGGIIVPGTLFGFDGSYYNSTTVEQGNGYWLRTIAAGQVTLTCGGKENSLLAKQQDALLDLTPFPQLKIQDASGAHQTLYFNVELNNPDEKIYYSMPPLPPQGAFDARFKGDFRIHETDEAVIELQTSHFPVTIEAANLPVIEKGSYAIQEVVQNKIVHIHQLCEGTPVQISNPQVRELRLVRTETLPVVFSVEQNYPNPFNPETEIRYSLPAAGKVTVIVYNALGQKVKTLVSDFQEAGFHRITWNGTDEFDHPVSSGIYLYRVQANGNQITKKMILLK